MTEAILAWLRDTPLVGLLLALIAADVLTGIMVAGATKMLNSTTSIIGMTRKVFMVLLVGVASLIEPHAQGIPLVNLVAMFYCASELLSILENATKLGLPIPKAFKNMLAKLQSEDELQVPAQTLRVKKPPSDFKELFPTKRHQEETEPIPKKDAADSAGRNPTEPA